MVKSKYFTVMITADGRTPRDRASWAYSIAVRYGRSKWMLTRNGGEKVASANLEGITVRKSGPNVFRLTMNDGACVDINRNARNGIMAITITLPQHYTGCSEGICGKLGDNKRQIFYKSDGSETRNGPEMCASWVPPADDNLFICSVGENGETKDCAGDTDLPIKEKFNKCVIPVVPPFAEMPEKPDPNSGVGASDGYVIEGGPLPKFRVEKIPAPTPDPADIRVEQECSDIARKACSMALTHALANKLVSPDDTIQSCVFDYCGANNPNVVETWKQQYFTNIMENVRSVINDRDASPAATVRASLVADQLCLMGRCERNVCHPGGNLTPTGCKCNPPFTGARCKRRIITK